MKMSAAISAFGEFPIDNVVTVVLAGLNEIFWSVEIMFDNSNNQFPTGHEEVILRWTIGMKKDEYSLDKKSASKSRRDEIF